MTHNSMQVEIGSGLSLEDVVHVARRKARVIGLMPGSETYRRVHQSAEWVRDTTEQNIRDTMAGTNPREIYGINTGFGIHAAGSPLDSPEASRQLSRNLVMSHSSGVGEYLEPEIVRAAVLIRTNTLATGRSGIRPQVIDLLIEMLNREIIPAIPSIGSLGASGDLAPLAHLALVISKPPDSMNNSEIAPGYGNISGEVIITQQDGTRQLVSSERAMIWEGTDQRIVLDAKEGLALTNGATFSAAVGALALSDATNLVQNAEIITAMCLEALCGYRDAFLPQIHLARGHLGQIASAANILALVEGSQLVDPGDATTDPVHLPPQDPYSLRCAPQVIGPIRETLAGLRKMLTREINSATDNPLIFIQPEDNLPRQYKAISGGNFHGEYLAFGMYFLSIVLTELASIAERRVFWLTNSTMSRGLPSMLVQNDETQSNSGLMIAQYVAAALVSKCKTLAHPDSVDSIPSSANQEDHVSMSMNAALHARQIVENATHVIGIELLAALTAMRHRLAGTRRDGTRGNPLPETACGKGAQAVLAAVHQHAPQLLQFPLDRDAVVYPYIRDAVTVVRSRILPQAIKATGITLADVETRMTL